MSGPGRAASRRTRRRGAGGAGTAVDLNLVSLIDVFTILIFFLLASAGPIQPWSAPAGVALPRAAAVPAAGAAKPGIELAVVGRELRVQGQAVGTLDDAGAATPHQGLRDALRAQAQPGRPLVVLADRELPWQQLGQLLRAAAAAGVDEVSFAVQVART